MSSYSTSQSPQSGQTDTHIGRKVIITARKRNLEQGNVFTLVCNAMMYNPRADAPGQTPPGQTSP